MSTTWCHKHGTQPMTDNGYCAECVEFGAPSPEPPSQPGEVEREIRKRWTDASGGMTQMKFAVVASSPISTYDLHRIAEGHIVALLAEIDRLRATSRPSLDPSLTIHEGNFVRLDPQATYSLEPSRPPLAAPSEPSVEYLAGWNAAVTFCHMGEPPEMDIMARAVRSEEPEAPSEVLPRTQAHVLMSQAMTRYADNPTSDNRGELLTAIHRWGDTLVRAEAPAVIRDGLEGDIWHALRSIYRVAEKPGPGTRNVEVARDWLRARCIADVLLSRWALAARPREEPEAPKEER